MNRLIPMLALTATACFELPAPLPKSDAGTLAFVADAPADGGVAPTEVSFDDDHLELAVETASPERLQGLAFRLEYDGAVLGLEKFTGAGPAVARAEEAKKGLLDGVVTAKGPWAGSEPGRYRWGVIRFRRSSGGESSLRFVETRTRVMNAEGELVALPCAGGQLRLR